MIKEIKIYVDRLKDGHTEQVNELLDPSVLDIQEQELSFSRAVEVTGEAYLAEDHLVFHFQIAAAADIPCAICNETFSYPLSVDCYHTEQLEELKSSVFNGTEAIREAILLQVPPFAECHEGKCPERKNISKFLKKEVEKPEPHVQFPFSNL